MPWPRGRPRWSRHSSPMKKRAAGGRARWARRWAAAAALREVSLPAQSPHQRPLRAYRQLRHCHPWKKQRPRWRKRALRAVQTGRQRRRRRRPAQPGRSGRPPAEKDSAAIERASSRSRLANSDGLHARGLLNLEGPRALRSYWASCPGLGHVVRPAMCPSCARVLRGHDPVT